MIVVDLGCMTYAAHPEDESMMTLINRFRPDVYYGFDPHPGQEEYDGYAGTWAPQAATIVRREAAWTYDGEIGLVVPPVVLNPLRTFTSETEPETVKCFDLAKFLLRMPEPVVVKMDVEGAEAVLLPHLIENGALDKIELLLVEVHAGVTIPPLTCPWEVWT